MSSAGIDTVALQKEQPDEVALADHLAEPAGMVSVCWARIRLPPACWSVAG
jgi:hypothetical protein